MSNAIRIQVHCEPVNLIHKFTDPLCGLIDYFWGNKKIWDNTRLKGIPQEKNASLSVH